MVNRQAYVLNGSLQQVLRSIDGVTSWMAGMILVNRANKESRKASKAKITYALKSGASVIMYPEGTWNKSPNELVSGLFPGIYDVAKESGALVVPVATYRNGSKSYGIMSEAFNICDYDKTNGLIILRDKMATMQYEMMEEYGRCERKNLPYGSDADNYWDNYINDLMSEVKFYEYELEKNTKYREKNITPPNEAFAFMDKLIPGKENAFLFRNNLYIRRNEL